MATTNNQYQSYDFGFAAGSKNREDLEDIIVNISPIDTPLYSTAPKKPISHTTHEWIEDALGAASGFNQKTEGHQFATADTVNTRSRLSNWSAIFGKDIEVSNTQRVLNPAGITDEYSYQIEIALKEIARNIESALFTNVVGASASGAIRNFKALNEFITTNTASATGAQGHAKATLDSLLESIFIQGGTPDRLYMFPSSKTWYSRELAGLTNSILAGGTSGSVITNYRLIQAGASMFDANIDVYRSNFGTIQLVPDRFMISATTTATASSVSASTVTAASSGNTGRIYAIETPKVQIGVLRPVQHYPLPPGGDSTRGMVLGEITLITMAEKAHGKIWNVQLP